MSTQFGFHSLSTSPARKRIEAAGIAFEHRQMLSEQKFNQLVRRSKAEMRRREFIERLEEAFRLTKRSKRSRTMHEIVCEVADKHRLPWRDIMGIRRAHHIVLARQEAMYRCRVETKHSLPAIGKFFDKDHTTVLFGVRAHERRLNASAALYRERTG